jgi:integrase
MDGLYLTDQRIGDVLKLDERDLLEQGVYVKQQKTGKELIIGWNDDLREWVAACRALHGNVVRVARLRLRRGERARPLLLRNRGGGARVRLRSARQWRKACAAAGVEDGHLHDGRAFSATEAKRQGHDAAEAARATTDAATRPGSTCAAGRSRWFKGRGMRRSA